MNILNKLSTYILPALAFWHLWDGGQAHLSGDIPKAIVCLLLAIFFILLEVARLLRIGLTLKKDKI